MTGFRRRTDALVHTVLVNAGLVPIPLFINAPDPQGGLCGHIASGGVCQTYYTGRQGKLQPRRDKKSPAERCSAGDQSAIRR